MTIIYTVYRTTNKINGKVYVGTHQTSDPNDDYLGSGFLLKKSIEKYGREAFFKEVIAVFDNPEEMFLLEAEIVDSDFIAMESTYNLKTGGFGGFDYLNSREDSSLVKSKANTKSLSDMIEMSNRWRRKMEEPEYREQHSIAIRNGIAQSEKIKARNERQIGSKPSDDTRAKISAAKKGKTTSSTKGKCWITDGRENKIVMRDFVLPDGWRFGRKM